MVHGSPLPIRDVGSRGQWASKSPIGAPLVQIGVFIAAEPWIMNY